MGNATMRCEYCYNQLAIDQFTNDIFGALAFVCKICTPNVKKTCTGCELALPLDKFHTQAGGKFGLRAICKSCVRDYAVARRSGTLQFTCRDCGKPRKKKQARCNGCYNNHRESIIHSPEYRKKRNQLSKRWRMANPEEWKIIYTKANRKAALKKRLKGAPAGTREYDEIVMEIRTLDGEFAKQ